MRILVAVKRVPDPALPVAVRADGDAVDLAGIRMVMNPFDEVALEAALRLRESGTATEIVAATAGPEAAEETLRTALALGADRAILLPTAIRLEPLAVAKLLAAVAAREHPDLILLGRQASDSDAGQTGPMLAGLLGIGQATGVVALSAEPGAVLATRAVEAGTITLRLRLPAVVTADLRLNQPRFVSLLNVMKARRSTIEVIDPAELGVDLMPRTDILAVTPAKRRRAGARLASPAELIERLNDSGLELPARR